MSDLQRCLDRIGGNATLNGHTVSRAYGDCKGVREVLEALATGKDFRIRSMHHPDEGRVFNLADVGPETTHFTVRYKRDTMVAVRFRAYSNYPHFCIVAVRRTADGRIAELRSGKHTRAIV